jgi:hypothetical protein
MKTIENHIKNIKQPQYRKQKHMKTYENPMKTSENPMKPTVIYGSRMVPKFLFAHPCETTVLKGSWV